MHGLINFCHLFPPSSQEVSCVFDAHDQCLSVGIFSVFIFCLLSFNLIVISAGKPGFWVKDLLPELFTAGAPRGQGPYTSLLSSKENIWSPLKGCDFFRWGVDSISTSIKLTPFNTVYLSVYIPAFTGQEGVYFHQLLPLYLRWCNDHPVNIQRVSQWRWEENRERNSKVQNFYLSIWGFSIFNLPACINNFSWIVRLMAKT